MLCFTIRCDIIASDLKNEIAKYYGKKVLKNLSIQKT